MSCLSVFTSPKNLPPPSLQIKNIPKKRTPCSSQNILPMLIPRACTPCRCSTDATLRPRRPSSSEPNFPVRGNKAIPERSDQISATATSSISFRCNELQWSYRTECVVYTIGLQGSNTIAELALKTHEDSLSSHLLPKCFFAKDLWVLSKWPSELVHLQSCLFAGKVSTT